MSAFPEYLSVPASELGRGTNVAVKIRGDMMSLAQDFAGALKDEIVAANREGRPAAFIIPVGPVDQYPILAKAINEEKISCRNILFIAMDEYLDDKDQCVDESHPLSFRGFLSRMFYGQLDPALAPPPGQRIFPSPKDITAVPEIIAARGGVDACFGGIGINGHIAFNEPPEADAPMSIEEFASLPTRVLSLSRETRTINSVTVGGEISIVPRRAVTVGMKEILGARRLRLYCNRPWQSSVVRRALHGSLSADCPASLIRTHPDASLTVTDYVAEPPIIKLR